MIANVDGAIEFIKINELNWWAVSTADKESTRIFEKRDDEIMDDAIERFKKLMTISRGSRFILAGRKKKEDGRNSYREEFKNIEDPPHTNTASPAPFIGEGMVAIGELDRRLKENEERVIARLETIRLKEENQQLRDEILAHDTTMNRVLKRAEPFIAPLLGALTNRVSPTAQIGVAGIEGDVNIEYSQDEEHRLSTALAEWQAVEPDFIIIIEKLAEMATQGDAMYTFAKNSIINK